MVQPAYLHTAAPVGLAVAFGAITLGTVLWFWLAVRRAAPKAAGAVLLGLAAWLAVQAGLAVQGFYQELAPRPPRLLLFAILPTLLVMGALFATKPGRRFLDALPLGHLTYLNVVRVPVELVLYGLFLAGQVPQLMTFEGRNWDIVAGLTAPLVGFWGFTHPRISRSALLIWHVVALALLLNIVAWAILSSPMPLQQVAFEQPNVAILKFPFVWLPAVVVPIVLLGHLVAIRQLARVQMTLPGYAGKAVA